MVVESVFSFVNIVHGTGASIVILEDCEEPHSSRFGVRTKMQESRQLNEKKGNEIHKKKKII